MSVTAAIINRFDSDSDSAIVAFREALGAGKLWAGKAPETKALPYGTVNQVGKALESETKGQTKRVEDIPIQIDLWAKTKAEVDNLLYLCEEAYIGHRLTIAHRGHLATYVANQLPEQTNQTLWRGFLELTVKVQK